MTPKDLKLEAVRLLDLIAAEFASDPMSVQCFDRRIVESVISVSSEARESGLVDEAWKAEHDRGN